MLPNFTISTNGQGQATLNNGVIDFTANENDDAVNLVFKPFVLSPGGLCFDVEGTGLIDVKFYSMKPSADGNSTYIIQQIPVNNETVEIDLDGVAAWIPYNNIFLIKISSSPGKYKFSNFRYGRYDIPYRPKNVEDFNLIPNGDFQFGSAGFTFYAGEGKFNQRIDGGFKFDYVSGDKGFAFICTDELVVKAGKYTFETSFSSDKQGVYRWFVANDEKVLGGQYWADQTISKVGFEQSGGTFTVLKDTKIRIYFAIFSPVSFTVFNMKLKPSSVDVSIVGTDVVINGVPEHIIGVYHDNAQKVADVGFRHHKPEFIPNDDDISVYVKNGIYFWADISGIVRTHMLEAAASINKLYHQPNMVGYYVDEPDHVDNYCSPSLLRTINSLLPKKPLWTVVMSWYTNSSAAQQYQSSCSIISSDIYQKDNNQTLGWLVTKIRDFMRVTTTKPRIVVVECNDQLSYDEQRVQAWLPMASGANGVFFWVLDKVNDTTNLKKVITELNSFRYITGPSIRLNQPIPMCWKVSEKIRLVGVNPTDKKVDIAFDNFYKVKPLLNAADVTYGTQIKFSVKPYEPFVLEVIG